MATEPAKAPFQPASRAMLQALAQAVGEQLARRDQRLQALEFELALARAAKGGAGCGPVVLHKVFEGDAE